MTCVFSQIKTRLTSFFKSTFTGLKVHVFLKCEDYVLHVRNSYATKYEMSYYMTTRNNRRNPFKVAPITHYHKVVDKQPTSWLLLIYSFSFSYVLRSRNGACVSSHNLRIWIKINTFFPWPYTLTYDLHLWTWLSQHQPARQISRLKIISFASYCADTHTANRLLCRGH